MSNRASVVTVSSAYPGGTTTTLGLGGGTECFTTQIVFSRATGSVTVKARRGGSTRFVSVVDGVVDLTTQDGITISDASIAELQFIDAGTGTYTVTVTQK